MRGWITNYSLSVQIVQYHGCCCGAANVELVGWVVLWGIPSPICGVVATVLTCSRNGLVSWSFAGIGTKYYYSVVHAKVLTLTSVSTEYKSCGYLLSPDGSPGLQPPPPFISPHGHSLVTLSDRSVRARKQTIGMG